jgi:DNA-binding GntR family transcriptional regulator
MALAGSLTAEIRLALAKVDRIRRNARAQVHAHESLVALLEAGQVDAVVEALTSHLQEAEASMLAALELAPPE